MNRPCQTGDRKKTRAKPWRATASREVTTLSTMADENQHKDEQNNQLPPDPADVDDMMLDIDGDGFIFSDDAFPSLPDFPCLSSPCASPSPSSASTMLPSKNAPPLSSCSSASSPSSSSSWSFLQVPEGGGSELPSEPAPSAEDFMMLSQPPSGEFSDILGDIDLFDLSVDPWDPSSLLHADDGSASEAVPEEVVEVEGQGGGGSPLPVREEEGSSEELARIFLDWLRNNKDAISPEDLRSIKLKRATIESAARRLGRTKQGRTQLLRLILTWVQNNHLQRRRQQRPPCHAAPPNPTPLDYAFPAAADSNLAPRCTTWMPYSIDPSAGSPNPALLAAYGGGGNGDMAYPYTSSLMVNSQPFSPSTDYIDPAASGGPWSAPLASPMPPQFAHPLSLVAPTQYSGGFANHLLGPMCHQGQRLAGVAASATKEARKKRMARQRRVSSLHHHRGHSHHQQQNLPHAHHGVGTAEVANGTPNPNPRSWGFWANMSPSSHHLGDTRISSNMQHTTSTPPSAAAQLQHRPQQPTAATSAEKRQGWKGEKNLKFLLQKVLKQSDVGSLGRIVLPKKEAETHLPELDARDGISIPMEDIGTSQVWNMRYRFWPNNKSRMYLLENTGDFVRSNGLQEGDFIVIYSDVKCSKYMIRGVKVRQAAAEPRAASGRNAVKARPRRNGSEKMRGSGVQEGADEDEDIIAPP